METPIETIAYDLEIVIEAINTKDTLEAVAMLKDIIEDLKIMALTQCL